MPINAFLSRGLDGNGGSARVVGSSTGIVRAGLCKLDTDDRRFPTVVTVQVSAAFAVESIVTVVATPRAWVEFSWGTGRTQQRGWVDAIPGSSFSLSATAFQAEAVVEGPAVDAAGQPVALEFALSIAYNNHHAHPFWGGPLEVLGAATPGPIRALPPFATGVALLQSPPSTAANVARIELSPNQGGAFSMRQTLGQSNTVPTVVQPLMSGMRFYRIVNDAVVGAIIQPRFEIAL